MQSNRSNTTSQPSRDERQGLRRHIVLNSLLFVVSRGLAGGLAALASLFLYRELGPDHAGRFSLVLALVTTLGIIGGLGFHGSLPRFIPERTADDAAGVFRRALRMSGMAILVIWLAFLVLAGLGWLIPPEVRAVAPVFLFAIAVHAVYSTSQGMLRGQGRLQLLPRLDFGANFLARVTALGVIVLWPGYASAFTAYTVVQVAVLAVALYLLRSSLGWPEVRFSRDEVVFSRYVVVGELARVLIYTAHLYIIRVFLGSHEVGIFAAGSRLSTMVELLVLSPISVPLLYYFSHPESAHMRARILRRGTRVIGTAMGFAALILAILAEPIVEAFLGEAFGESAAVARVYASHSLGVSLLVLFIPFYASVNKPQYGVTQLLLTFVVNLSLSLVLIPRYGPVGAAMASVASITVTVVGASLFLERRFSLDVRRTVFRVFLLYAVSYVLVATGYPLVGVLVYLASIWPLRLLGRDDFGLFRHGSRS